MSYIYSFLMLMIPWIVLSGFFDSFHLTLGIISSAMIAAWSGDILFKDLSKSAIQRLIQAGQFFQYVIWLLYEVVMANLHVTYLAFHPNVTQEIDPVMIRFKSNLKSEVAQFILANSITLTPGTVTVRITDSEFLVHSISRQAAEGMPGIMEKKIKRIFES
ncbi:MAG: cation transporter [Actinobacteria bacterium]|nr:cation transporter [Actinomycetota bacterium]